MTPDQHNLPPRLNAIAPILLEKFCLSITDAYGNIVYVSHAFCEQCGYSRDELIGQNHSMLKSNIHSDSYYAFLWTTITSGNEWRGEVCNRKKDGSHYWVEREIIPILDDDNNPEYYVALSNDVTKNKALIRKLQKRAQQQGLVAILGHLSINTDDIDMFIEESLAAISGALEMQQGMMFTISSDRQSARLTSSTGELLFTQRNAEIRLQDNNLLDYILQHEDPVVSRHLCKESRFSLPPALNCRQDLSAIGLNIGDQHAPSAIMLLLSNSRRDINMEDAHFAQTVGNLISEARTRHTFASQLHHEKELNRKYLDVANFIIVILDQNGEITLANQKASAILGLPQEKLLGKRWFDEFIPAAERLQAKTDFKTMLHNTQELADRPNPGFRSTIVNDEGEHRLIYWNNTLIVDESTRQPLLLCAGEDITELERARVEKNNLTRELYQAQKMEALGILAGGIAHDFNNILGSILGFTELSLERLNDSGNEKLISYLKQIRNSGLKARDIIAQIQNLNNPAQSETKAVILPSLIRDILKMMKAAIPKSVNFEQMLDVEVPAVTANPALMNQLVMNLIINARNALSGHGKLQIFITDRTHIEGRCASCGQTFSGHYIELGVADSGPGIDLDRLQDYFEQDINPYLQDGTSGGLKSIHRVTHDSRGHILVDSNPDIGTVFRILFEVSGKPHVEQQEQPKLSDIKSVTDQQTDIMIVDDENSVASFVGELFNQYGFTSHVFTDPTEALKAFTDSPQGYQLVVTDQTMPAINGDQLAQRMIELNPDIPIIMCTGYSDVMDEQRAAELNIGSFLKKPVQPTELLANAYRLLDREF